MIGMALIVILIWWYEWSRLGREKKKEKAAVAVLLCLTMLLGVILIINPEPEFDSD